VTADPNGPLRRTAVRVLAVEALVLALLWLAGRYFGG
jgi:hypothetical protein